MVNYFAVARPLRGPACGGDLFRTTHLNHATLYAIDGWLVRRRMAITSADAMHHKPGSSRAIVSASSNVSAVIGHIELTCQAAVEGRRAARALTAWARRFALSEPDFQSLWCLQFALHDRLDQATLANRLALSPAQLSNTVDRLGRQGWIARDVAPGDRRRHLWQLTPDGEQLLERMLTTDGPLRYESRAIVMESDFTRPRQKEAA